MLLVVFVLHVAGASPFDWSESQALNGELEIKAVVLEPDNNDSPTSGIQHVDNRAGRLALDGPLAVETCCARNDADTGALIRGPPAGKPGPA